MWWQGNGDMRCLSYFKEVPMQQPHVVRSFFYLRYCVVTGAVMRWWLLVIFSGCYW